MTRLIRPTFVALLMLIGAPAAYADQPQPWGLWMQEPASPIMHQIYDLHLTISVIILAILVFVFIVMGVIIVRFHHTRQPEPQQWSHNTLLEVAWTLVPVLILVGVAFPSFKLLYAMDRAEKADFTIKATGHQWYWSYSYPDQNIAFDASMVQDESLEPGQPRLLSADAKVMVPVGAVVRILSTADDVIHSWSMPAFGVKIDAIPGRLNEAWFKVERPGTYYGQCSQLCGINHGFMPIQVEAVSKEDFDAWVEKNAQKTSSASHTQLADARLTKE
jgi:cytochrome c oxidase subunit 2